MSAGGDKPRRHSYRVFPNEAKSTRGSFAQFIEESGTNFLLTTAIADLFDLPNKPENPIEWFRLYFQQLASKRTTEIIEDQNALKTAILKQESMLVHLRLEQHHLEVKLDELYYEANHVHSIPPKPIYDEDFRRYKDVLDDPRWRIRPDPDVVVTKKDILMQALENEGKSKSRLNVRSSTNFQQEQEQDAWTKSSVSTMQALEDREDYKDYPKLYFGIDDSKYTECLGEDEEEEFQGCRNLDDADQAQMRALLSGTDGESGGEEEMIPEDGLTTEEEEEQFGSLKSGRSGKRTGEPGKSVTLVTTDTATSVTTAPSKTKSKTKRGKKGKGDKSDNESVEGKGKKKKGKKSKKSKSKSKVKLGDKSSASLATTEGSEQSLDPSVSEMSQKSGKKGKKKKKKKKDWEDDDDEDVVESMPLDPLTLELPPVTPDFWKEDFSLTKGHENMFDFDNAGEFGYEDVLLDEEFEDDPTVSGVYLNSRGEKRKRRFQSQIIHDAFFKPDRGGSIELDTRLDPMESENPSTTVLPSEGGVDEIEEVKSNPSVVTATISDGTIVARLSRDKSHTKIDEFRRSVRERERKMS